MWKVLYRFCKRLKRVLVSGARKFIWCKGCNSALPQMSCLAKKPAHWCLKCNLILLRYAIFLEMEYDIPWIGELLLSMAGSSWDKQAIAVRLLSCKANVRGTAVLSWTHTSCRGILLLLMLYRLMIPAIQGFSHEWHSILNTIHTVNWSCWALNFGGA